MKKVLSILLAVLISTAGSFSQVISAGTFHSLFVCYSGSAKSTGQNVFGKLGDGTTADKNTPVQVSGLTTGVIAVAGGGQHSLFLKNDGTAWTCGWNNYGQLGDGTNTNRLTPVQVSGLTNVIAVATTEDHSLFLKSDSTVWGCGRNDWGQFGDGTTINRNIPVQVNGLTGIIAIAAGGAHSLFLKKDGTVWACGANVAGELGIGNYITKTIPVQVSVVTNIIAIAAGYGHSLFLKNDGTVWVCGYNNGTFGNGNINNSTVPVQSNITGVMAIGTGKYHSLFVKSDGTAWGTGYNGYGELGDGTTIDRISPVQASGLTNIIAATGGLRHMLWVKNDGTVWSCGKNIEGQLGIGNNTEQHIPVQVNLPCSVLGEEEFEVSGLGFEVYPNPSDGKFTIGSKQLAAGSQTAIEVYNVMGEKIYSAPLLKGGDGGGLIDLSSQPDGIYFVRVKTEQGIVSRKVVVMR